MEALEEGKERLLFCLKECGGQYKDVDMLTMQQAYFDKYETYLNKQELLKYFPIGNIKRVFEKYLSKEVWLTRIEGNLYFRATSSIEAYFVKAVEHYEHGDYDQSIAICAEAFKLGQYIAMVQTEYTAMAQAEKAKFYVLMAKGNWKKGELMLAKDFYEKAFSARSTPSIVQEYRELVEQIKNDPDMVQQENNKGVSLYNEGDYAGAMKCFSELINWSCGDTLRSCYLNRASCFIKMGLFEMALNDCESSLRIDSNYAKAYVRKGNAFFGLHKFEEAKHCWISALQIDTNNREAKEWLMKCVRIEGKDPEKALEFALQDPEVEQILKTSHIRAFLDFMHLNPTEAVQVYGNFEELDKKSLAKLRDAGIIDYAQLPLDT